MKRYLIEEVKHDYTNQGMASTDVTSIKFNDGEKSSWLTINYLEAVTVMLTEDDVFDRIIDVDNDEAFWAHLEDHIIESFDGIDLGEDYSDIYANINKDLENPAAGLIKYLLAVHVGVGNNVDLIKTYKGKYVDEIALPKTCIEEEMEENEAWEDSEEYFNKRFFIEDVKCGVTKGGIACGPVSGNAVTSIKYLDGEHSKWINLVDVSGSLNTFLTDIDIYDKLIEENFEDQEFTEFMHKTFISEFEGIKLEDFYNVYGYMKEHPDNPANPLLRYLFAVTLCGWDDLDRLIVMGKGKYADELDVPMTDLELELEEEEE